jgi:SAM-dependent methyltransferase
MSTGSGNAKSFWDARAREDAFYFVDNRLEYGSADEQEFWAGGERDLDTMLGALDVALEPSDEAVEIGCGVGRLTRVIAARAARVTALDVSPEMIALARRHNGHLENVTWVEGDGTSLAGIADASATACVSHVVFQHIPDPRVTYGYVREMGRVLRPGGWSAFQVSNDPAVHRQAPPLVRSVKALVGRSPRGTRHRNWRGSAVDLGELRSAAADGGLDLERVWGEGSQFCLVLLRRR